MLYLHILAASLLYYIFSALWFSPLLAGNLWLKVLNWNMQDIQKQAIPKTHMFVMFFSAYFAGLFLAVVQVFLLKYFFSEKTFLNYFLCLVLFLMGFLVFPILPNYLFKSQKLGISMKAAFMLWIIETKPAGIGILLQAVYLFYIVKPIL